MLNSTTLLKKDTEGHNKKDMMEEREIHVLTTDAAVVENSDEALRNLTLAVSLIGAIVKNTLVTYGEMDPELEDAFGLIEQSIGSVHMYMERMGIWKQADSQDS